MNSKIINGILLIALIFLSVQYLDLRKENKWYSERVDELEKSCNCHTDDWIKLNEMFTDELVDQVKTIQKLSEQLQRLTELKVTVTFYSLSPSECDKDPYVNALGKRPVVGRDVAVSRDLMYLLGKKVYIEGFGVKMVTDLMNPKFKKRVDILVSNKKIAKRLGVRKNVKLIVLDCKSNGEAE